MVEEPKESGQKPGLRGLFYRKLLEREQKASKQPEKGKMQSAMPKLYIKKPGKIDLPKMSDITKLNVSYPLIEPFVSVNIRWDDKKKQAIYNVIEPQLTEEEKELVKKISSSLMELIDIDLTYMKEKETVLEYLVEKVDLLIKNYELVIDPGSYTKVMYYVYRNFVGLNEIEPLMQDPNIEDISCDGTGIPIYIIHRKYGSMITNIVFDSLESLREFIVKLSERSGRYVSYAEPILDSTLPDGSRVAATMAADVATRGGTFTIRKFSEHPFSPIEQIEVNTASVEMFAYIWYLVEHKSSGMIVGGTATGKTSFLNSLAMFITPESKVVSIEDTRELRLSHQHWISGLSRVGFGIPTPTGQKYGEVTLFDLLRETFRQNPDYVIVGETRGEETYVMFQGMASGHSSLSTFHAGSLDTLVKRLTTAPINLSPTLLESLNFLVVMAHAKEKGASARRVKEIVEIISVDPRTNEMATNITFRWDPMTDRYEKVNESVIVRRIASNIGATYENAVKEIERRKNILTWLLSRGTRDYIEFTKFVNDYYKEPERVIQLIGQPQPTVTARQPLKAPAEKPKRASILDLLGFKILKEKKSVQ